MTWRARLYLGIAGARHGVIGLALLLAPGSFAGRPFESLFGIAPEWVWTLVMLVGFAHLTYAAVSGNEFQARTALIVSGGISCAWAMAFGLIALHGSSSVLTVAIFGALAAKDMIVCAQPLRSPFEPIVRLYVDRGTGR